MIRLLREHPDLIALGGVGFLILCAALGIHI